MRDFVRHLYAFCSAASLLLCLAACAMWARSFGVADIVALHAAPTGGGMTPVECNEWSVLSSGGVIRWQLDEDLPVSLTTDPSWQSRASGGNDLGQLERTLGFGYDRWRSAGPRRAQQTTTTTVFVPWWALALAAGVLPMLWLRRHRERRRRANLCLCTNCGYDLRGSPARCPECGTPTAWGEAWSAAGHDFAAGDGGLSAEETCYEPDDRNHLTTSPAFRSGGKTG